MKLKRWQNYSTVTEIRAVVTAGFRGNEFPGKGHRGTFQGDEIISVLIRVMVT